MASNSTTGPNYPYVFAFEKIFDHLVVKQWMQTNWSAVCLYAIVIYMIVIFGGREYMRTRQRFEMRNILAMWNVFLAVFSIVGTCRTVQEFVHVLSKDKGFYHSICVLNLEHDPVAGFWGFAFVLSKVPELGDTVFIVLRKQPLIFLHWYHHISVLAYTWYSFSEYTAPARWYCMMNYTVHAVMYSYYALKALRFRIPRPIAMVITTLQLIQMIMVGIITQTVLIQDQIQVLHLLLEMVILIPQKKPWNIKINMG